MLRQLNMLVLAGTVAMLTACGSEETTSRGSAGNGSADATSNVVVNGQQVSQATLNQIQQNYGIHFEDGNFWYDSRSGLAGLQGQSVAAILPANLPLGTLQSSASNGHTSAFINGRELPDSEVAFLQQFGQVYAVHYWLDADGSYGVEADASLGLAQDVYLGNLYQVISQSRSGSNGGDNYNANGYTNSYSNSQGGCSYVMTDSGTATSGCG